jgi:hypothetical protein
MLMLASSVIVGELYLMRFAIAPDEADPPLIVDADAVLPLPVAAKHLQPITRHGAKLLEALRGMDQLELATRPRDDALVDTPHASTLEQRRGTPISEAPDHEIT